MQIATNVQHTSHIHIHPSLHLKPTRVAHLPFNNQLHSPQSSLSTVFTLQSLPSPISHLYPPKMAFVTSFLPSIRALPSRAVTPLKPRHVTAHPMRMTATKLSQFDSLRAITTIVEDTGEIDVIRTHRPHSATTNPTLVARAAAKPEYAHLLTTAVDYGNKSGLTGSAKLDVVRNKLFTLFGAEILKYVPGDVSTEVDARLSFDTEKQIEVAEQLIAMYEEVGIAKHRVLIKLATTWEGIQACRQLQKRGINTNMTLLFSLSQAIAAADAGAYLISPFVGRILDYYKKERGVDSIPAEQDPGVLSVRDIYRYYKCHGYDTIVMGASFRTLDEILALAGCDRLTISPKFVQMLKEQDGVVPRMLGDVECDAMERVDMDEKTFRWMMNEDPMATEKLAAGIRGFSRDLEKLDAVLLQMINN